MSNLDKVLTTQEAAEMLNLSDSRIRQKLRDKEIPEKYYRKTKKITMIDIKWIEIEKKRTIK